VTDDDALRFVLKMALRNPCKLVKGLRKQVGEIDERIVVTKLLSEIDVVGYKIVRKHMRYAFGAVSYQSIPRSSSAAPLSLASPASGSHVPVMLFRSVIGSAIARSGLKP
jgi:hypothetical protein